MDSTDRGQSVAVPSSSAYFFVSAAQTRGLKVQMAIAKAEVAAAAAAAATPTTTDKVNQCSGKWLIASFSLSPTLKLQQ